MSYRRAFLCVAVLVAGTACGTSGGNGGGEASDGGLNAIRAGGPRRPSPGRGDSGTTPIDDRIPGEGIEGDPCESVADCELDLACVDTGRFTVGFCARPCSADADCGRDICFSYTGNLEDAHCVNLEREEYGDCGEAFTALCAGDRTCLTFPDLPIGVCVDICELGASDSDAGAVGDGDAGTGLATCRSEQVCTEGVLADETRGVCGTTVTVGQECGIDIGLFCDDGSLCSREDPENFDEAPVCRQDCSDGEDCPDGTTCTDFRGQFAVCL